MRLSELRWPNSNHERLSLQHYQRLAKWGLQQQLKAISHVSMRAVDTASLIQDGLNTTLEVCRVWGWVRDGAMQLCKYSQTMVQCAREISEAVQGLEPLECVYYDSHT